jgi:hypothetical protein
VLVYCPTFLILNVVVNVKQTMKKIKFIFLILVSCIGKSDIQQLDSEINTKLETVFISNNSDIWIDVEGSFLNHLEKIGILTKKSDSLKVITNFICSIASNGGIPDEFRMKKSQISNGILTDLKEIGFLKDDNFDYNFIYLNYNPIVKTYVDSNLETEHTDILVGMGLQNPNNNDFNLSIISNEICNKYDSKDFARPGLYKSIVILYFGNLINDAMQH